MSYKHAVSNKSSKISTLKSYTGATGNYIRGKDTIILKNLEPTTTCPRVRLPDNSIIQPKLPGHITLPMLPSEATQAQTYPNRRSSILLSIGKLCDSDCSALFTKKDITIFNSEKTPVLNVIRNTYDGLWYFTIQCFHQNHLSPQPSLIKRILSSS